MTSPSWTEAELEQVERDLLDPESEVGKAHKRSLEHSENSLYLEPLVLEEGNTSSSNKKSKKSAAEPRITANKRWAFTWNNYTEEGIEKFVEQCKLHDISYIFGKEKVDTDHLQGYIESTKRIRPFAVWTEKAIHWEKARGTRAQNIAYCSKDTGRDKTMTFWYPACMKPPRKMCVLADEDMHPWQFSLRAAMREEPNDRIVHWLCGLDGGEGKTTWAKKMCVEEGAIMLGGKAADVKNGIVTFKKETGDTPEIIIINVPRSQDMAYVSYQAIEDCKDMCFYSGKYEGGMVCGMPAHVVVLSNEMPMESKMSKDRWNIWVIDGDQDKDFPWEAVPEQYRPNASASARGAGATASDSPRSVAGL